jgi:tetratricopeptide (TPR) repeat protein
VQAAAWIDGLGRPDDHAEVLGHHYQQALALARAAGADLGPAVPRARAVLTQAGDRARTLYAFDAAERFYADALALWPGEAAAERADIVYRNALAVFERGAPGYGDVLDDAADALRAVGDDLRAADLEQLRAEAWWMAGEHDRCWAHLHRAREMVTGAPPRVEKARVLAQVIRFDQVAGRYDAQQVGEALAVAEALGLDELRAHVLISAGAIRARGGDEAGLRQLAQGLEAARAGNWLFAIDRGATNLGTLRTAQGRAREALELQLEAARAAERMGSLPQVRWTRGNVIQCWFECGDWALAVPAADEFLTESRRTGAHYLDTTMAAVRALARLGSGDLDGAAADAAFAVDRARSVKDPQILYVALAMTIQLHLEAGRPDEARRHFDELAGDDAAVFDQLDFVIGDVAWAATQVGRADAARRGLAGRDWPSFRAARAIVGGDFAHAAAIYDEHGAARSAAMARLRGGLDDGARAFFARIGATRYAEM